MKLEKGYIYHIYNQGNNRRKIFFSRRNYLFFIKKIRMHILPYSDIISWCLMPNHFHLMVYVKDELVEITEINKKRSINHSIGILLRSYARAINKQEDLTGSLFRQDTKAICVNCNDEKTTNFVVSNYGTLINIKEYHKQYPQICFDYIHQNPVKAGLAVRIQDWEFSSAREYISNKEILVCKKRAEEFIDFPTIQDDS